MRRALIIVGKPPEPGFAKTRLVPPLSYQDAAALYRGFLLDSVGMGHDLGWERVTIVHPRHSGPALAALVSSEVRLLEQRGHGLASALPDAFAAHLAEGFARVVLIGSDSPTLPLGLIEQACTALASHDVSIGPTSDGGYYLIGLREPHLALFEGIDWSTSRVFSQTLDHAVRLGLKVRRLRAWYDVDEPTDLKHLQRDLATSPASLAPHTRAALQRLAHNPRDLYSGATGSGGTNSVGPRPDRSA
ncbi:MAG: TIGR04282 family arsenosugar biosynthesis glycosyltransferase [Chloroflexota bacterium]|nr:TIGR04282 family arsenosugar biosynthesis glycosyltransferase [Chloroflexota bacterium]